MSWILKVVDEVVDILKVLVVLEASLEVVVEVLEIRCLSFIIWVVSYCRKVFSL